MPGEYPKSQSIPVHGGPLAKVGIERERIGGPLGVERVEDRVGRGGWRGRRGHLVSAVAVGVAVAVAVGGWSRVGSNRWSRRAIACPHAAKPVPACLPS